ncbi:GumC family protein [Parafilimonas sp.]|uniref:GumC family protein n=1 Tax=Parafilimonas sp. TaxID=1969739 RepID=UPI003F7E5408
MTDNSNDRQNLLVLEMTEQKFNLKELLFKYVRHWPWILLSFIMCLLLAFLYLRYSTSSYKINSKILIKDDQSTSASSEDILSDIDIFNTKNNVNSEIQVLKTHYLLSKVVNEMNLNIRYFTSGNIKSTEIYDNRPFKLNLYYLKDSIRPQEFDIKFPHNENSFTINSDEINGKFKFGDTVKTENVRFSLQPVFSKKGDYAVSISTPAAKTEEYYNKLTTEIPDKQANVILLTLEETVPKRGEDILNKLYEVYTRINQEDKNTIADSTIDFINSRLEIVSNELSGVEKNIEQFKTANNVYSDLDQQGALILNNVNDLQKQLIQQQVQISVVQSIEDNIKNNPGRVVPNVLEIQDPTYISTVEKYNNLVLERDRQLQTSKPDNPLIKNLNVQIETVRGDLLTSLTNIKQSMVIAQKELEKSNRNLSGQIKTAPAKERVYLDISRQQNVKQQLYLYLLQKREETAISKSGTLSNSRLIEPAKSNLLPFTPNKQLIYLIACAIGLLLPLLIISSRDFLNNKISDKKDITGNTKVPILGELGHNKTGETVIIKEDSRSALSEQFRIIRTNLQFVLKGNDSQVILVTSSMSSEGKSFFSINLASSFAISGKRVVLMEMDLRKPKIAKDLKISGEDGFTNYIISNLQKEQLAKPSAIHPNFFIITSGTIPPNPAELLLHDKVDELFRYLKTQFDYIIIDTPPVAIVTDAILLAKYADGGIYIVRENYTLKQQIDIINDLSVHSKIPNLSILLNDIKPKRAYRYGYGYHYGYAYSGYYTDGEEKRHMFGKAKKRNSNKVNS